MEQRKVYIFDTTLRDGQQSPGAGMSFEDNIQYADYAQALNIDVLEAGFPAASQLDFEIVHTIAKRQSMTDSKMIIAGLCQLRESQLTKTMEALAPLLPLNRARVHLYLPVDPNLALASLGQKNDEDRNIAEVYRLIKLAVTAGYSVEFSAEGYSRLGDGFDYVTDLFKAAVTAGASVLNCPDTIGGASKHEGDAYFVNNMIEHDKIIRACFPDKDILFSTHCHNDFGLALENSINATFTGPARQIEACINGVGERAGNAALEQCVMYIHAFGNQKNITYKTDVNIGYLKQVSDFIAQKMLPRQPHSPIVGINAARHTSGGHTNAILNNPLAYQPFDPDEIGSKISFVFGPLSGSNHAKNIIESFGYICEDHEKIAISQYIKDHYHDRRKGVTDIELIAAYKAYRSPIQAADISYGKVHQASASLTIEGRFFDQPSLSVVTEGKNSALAALVDATGSYIPGIEVIDYFAHSMADSGINSESEATIIVSAADSGNYKGIARDSDIEISALKAFIDAVNKLYVDSNYRQSKTVAITSVAEALD
ncbi:MAG: LeuA family protein [Francisellaceae bacterium]